MMHVCKTASDFHALPKNLQLAIRYETRPDGKYTAGFIYRRRVADRKRLIEQAVAEAIESEAISPELGAEILKINKCKKVK